jgi:polar amino acid transport system substrate-binding protein
MSSRVLWRPAAAAVIAAVLLTACGSNQPASSASAKPSFVAGSMMAKIQARGTLIAGARADVRSFGFVNPTNQRYEGFDVDLLREVARAIFGDPEKIEFKTVTSATRIPLVKEGAVDIVASTMTITDARAKEIDFSAVYYLAQQKVLVKSTSPITSIKDTAGKRVCASKGSTSAVNIKAKSPTAEAVLLDNYQECLAAIQSGRVDAISTDDAILGSLVKQDSTLKVVGPAFSDEPYGLGIQLGHPEFVTFVNGVIAKVKSNGRWKELAALWLGDYGKSLQPPGPATPAPTTY